MALQQSSSEQQNLCALRDFLHIRRRLVVLTGAGCSTRSGIPDYRHSDGSWKQKPPMRYQEFIKSPGARQRYWARSVVGWERMAKAEPNDAHRALARLERRGIIDCLITQNVDGLHQKAGSVRVVDLHGRLDRVFCLDCRSRSSRTLFQTRLTRLNPDWNPVARLAPDGDAVLAGADFSNFVVPACQSCQGILKPDVVFFGEGVPRTRVDRAMQALSQADSLLVVGSSLMVWSGYRFVRQALKLQIPVAILNLGRTRADSEVALKLSGCCSQVLSRLF